MPNLARPPSFRALVACGVLLVSLPVVAQVTVTDAWVRGTVAGQQATGAFMTLSTTAKTTLVSVATPIAKTAEVHEMAMTGGVMSMRSVPALELIPGKTVELAPGSYHVMLMDLNQPLRDGQSVALTLVFQDASGKQSKMDVKATVQPLTAPGGAERSH